MEHKENDHIKFTNTQLILIIFVVAVVFRLFTVLNYGENLKIFADDRHYLYGSVNFLKNGHIAGNPIDEHTVISMPGTYLWLAGLMKIFGYTQTGLKMVRASLGVLDAVAMLGLYKFVKHVFNVKTARLASVAYAVCIPLVCGSVLTVSDSLTIFGLTWFFYYAVKYCDTREDLDFLRMFCFYFIALLQRATVALIPATLIFYFYKNKFPLRLLISRCLYAITLIAVLLTPWWYRNYLVTGDFIPTTVGGDAFLGGTYYCDIELEEELSLPYTETRSAFNDPDLEDSLYHRMMKQSDYAHKRISAMWEKDKIAFLKGYLVKKPILSWKAPVKKGIIFDISDKTLDTLYKYCVSLAVVGCLFGLISKKMRNGTSICIGVIIYHAIFTALFLPFAGYNFPAYPFGLVLGVLPILIVADLMFIGIEKGLKLINRSYNRGE